MEYTSVATTENLSPGEKLRVQLDEKDIVICNVNGELYAVDNICSHAYALLHEGLLRRFRIICPLHGAAFDVRDGCVLGKPAKDPIQTYPVRVSGNSIEVALGGEPV